MKVTDFVKGDSKATFSHYRAGFLYYEVSRWVGMADGYSETYSFPVEVSDLQQATVNKEEKALTLMRYIRKAIEDKTMQLVRTTAPTLVVSQRPSFKTPSGLVRG